MKWILPMMIGAGIAIYLLLNRGKIEVFLTDYPEYKHTFSIKDLMQRPGEPDTLFEYLAQQISLRLRL